MIACKDLEDRFILTFSIVPNGYLLVCFQEGLLDNFGCTAADLLCKSNLK